MWPSPSLTTLSVCASPIPSRAGQSERGRRQINACKEPPFDVARITRHYTPTPIQADAGTFDSVALDTKARTIRVVFADPAATPAGTQSYDVLRLRCDKVSQPDAKRPGTNFRVTHPASKVAKSRGAFEIPAGMSSPDTVTIAYD